MKYLFLIFSIIFSVYGILPYHKATNLDTTKPNQLLVSRQECGCPCPDVEVIKGKLQIPNDIALKYPTLKATQLNLDINSIDEPYNYELGHAKLYITGKVVGADTILCEQTKCELAPRFQVDSWALVDNVANAWTFPNWLAFLFLINLFLLMPTLIIIEVKNSVRKRK